METSTIEAKRLSGVVVSSYQSSGKYEGNFGEILGDNGRTYVWSAGHVYRNRSHATVGAKVTFEASGYGSYATNIDSNHA